MLIIFLDPPNDERIRGMTFVYDLHHAAYTSNSGWSSSDSTDSLTVHVSRTNVTQILENQQYAGYPVILDVSSWEIIAPVNIGEHAAIVVNESRRYGYDCWDCYIDEDTTVYYDKETGLFIHRRYSTSGVVGFMDMWMVSDEITLSKVDYAGLYAYEIKQTGVILAAIFAELAVIIWLAAVRLKKRD
jgi:hypothetical protein